MNKENNKLIAEFMFTENGKLFITPQCIHKQYDKDGKTNFR